MNGEHRSRGVAESAIHPTDTRRVLAVYRRAVSKLNSPSGVNWLCALSGSGPVRRPLLGECLWTFLRIIGGEDLLL